MDQIALAAALALARDQHGLVTWDQTLGVGLTPVQIRRLVAEGHWEKLGHGVYQVNGTKQAGEGGSRPSP